MRTENGFDLTALSDTVLLVPSISIANIPQLATDLLIHTWGFAKVATLADTYLYPFISPADYSEKAPGGISYALEVYYSAQHKLSLIQQRSPLVPGFAQQHVAEVLVPFVKTGQFEHVVFLDLADAGLVEHIAHGEIQIYTNEDLLSQLNTLHISDRAKPLASTDHSVYAQAVIDGLGVQTKLSVLVTYVYEGDNSDDAHALATKVAEVLKIEEPKRWNAPVSWLGVYGDNPIPLAMENGLYG